MIITSIVSSCRPLLIMRERERERELLTAAAAASIGTSSREKGP